MIKRIDGRFNLNLDEVLNRKITSFGDYDLRVRDILKNVRENGDIALFEYAQKFDGVALKTLEVTKDEVNAAFLEVKGEFCEILKQAIQNITDFHNMQVRQGFELKKEDGIVLGQRITPIEKVGIYVPGGTASYPSTVLMNAVPAKIAGVKEIIMTTPPMKNGKIKAEILVAATLAGVNRIFKCGGAGAIAALAYGTNSIPKVDKIVGPGNIYVALAKKELFGIVGIDMVAGPSEILVIASAAANPKHVAADLLSQAEHDILASAVLITNSKTLADGVEYEIEKQLKTLCREDIARASIENNGKIILVNSLDDAIEISNAIAPEHLELCVENPFELMQSIKNAGSIFLGMNAPEALGDYFAGTNHTLPTSGSAKFSSPLSVDDFVKKSSYIYYTATALDKVCNNVAAFAEVEGLGAHAQSALSRRE